MKRLQAEGRLYWGVDGTATTPMRKLFLSEAKAGMTTPSILPDMPLNQHAARELEILFGQKSVFDTPKPVGLLQLLAHLGSKPGDICLDFFAGSGSFAEAVMSLNASDGGNRRYIIVQLPEPISDSAEARIAKEFCLAIGKPASIGELTKERLRRAGANLKNSAPLAGLDTGFRVFRLSSSNLKAWRPNRDELPASLLDSIDHVGSDRGSDDLLYEILLKLGLDLCVQILVRPIAGKPVQAVGGGVLITCLDPLIEAAEAEPLALGIAEWRKELDPAGDVTCVFRDSAFENDVAKTNLAAILEQHGIAKVRSL